jgi:hypothetical protein
VNAYVRASAVEVILQVAAEGDPEVLEAAEGMPLGGILVGLMMVLMMLDAEYIYIVISCILLIFIYNQ